MKIDQDSCKQELLYALARLTSISSDFLFIPQRRCLANGFVVPAMWSFTVFPFPLHCTVLAAFYNGVTAVLRCCFRLYLKTIYFFQILFRPSDLTKCTSLINEQATHIRAYSIASGAYEHETNKHNQQKNSGNAQSH